MRHLPFVLALAFACGGAGDDAPVDTDIDTVDTVDTVETDVPADDIGVDTDLPVDTEPGVPLPGYGALTGDCGVLSEAVWGSADPFAFRSALDLGATPWDPTQLSADAQALLDIGTIGGSSIESEALSLDLLVRCELATLLKGEPEITYDDDGGKKTDILVEIDGRKIGVSVTRALSYVYPEPCGPVDEDALSTLMTRKVSDLQLSFANASDDDAWERSMLYVIACDEAHAQATLDLFAALDPTVRADAVLIVTSTQGEDAAIY